MVKGERERLMEKLVIAVAPTGSFTFRNQTPYVPITPKEIAEEVYECWKAGASIAHIHVREDDGTPTMNLDRYRETVERIQDKCDILISLTSSGKVNPTDEERLAVCDLQPHFASFNAGSMNFGEIPFMNSPEFMRKLAKRMQENNVKPEIEIFEQGMIGNATKIANEGLIDAPYHYQFVLGAPGGTPATPKNLIHLLDHLPENSTWGVVAFENQVVLHSLAIYLGGHVRVGMEDNYYYRPGELAKSNVDFVKRVAQLSHDIGREIATPEEAKKILNLKTVEVDIS